MSSLPDPSRIPDHLWEFESVSSDGLRRHYVYCVDKANGVGFRKSENLGEDELKLLKALLPELSKQRDRLYGKTRQRLSTTSVSASVDINELMRQGQAAKSLEPGGEVIDVEVLDEQEDIDE